MVCFPCATLRVAEGNSGHRGEERCVDDMQFGVVAIGPFKIQKHCWKITQLEHMLDLFSFWSDSLGSWVNKKDVFLP